MNNSRIVVKDFRDDFLDNIARVDDNDSDSDDLLLEGQVEGTEHCQGIVLGLLHDSKQLLLFYNYCALCNFLVLNSVILTLSWVFLHLFL